MTEFEIKFYGLIAWVFDRSTERPDRVVGLLPDAAYGEDPEDADDRVFPPHVDRGRRTKFPAHFPFPDPRPGSS